MTHPHRTQAEKLVIAIRRARRGLTYGELERLGISTCPWGRLRAGEKPERYLHKGEVLTRKTGADGLVRFIVTRA